ncbi:hypothetical protein E8D37_06785 [Nocardioides sp. GY 10127]|nr:hypothetical protein E8D37_06785 [Nocardioides sp. GY 10127]
MSRRSAGLHGELRGAPRAARPDPCLALGLARPLELDLHPLRARVVDLRRPPRCRRRTDQRGGGARAAHRHRPGRARPRPLHRRRRRAGAAARPAAGPTAGPAAGPAGPAAGAAA